LLDQSKQLPPSDRRKRLARPHRGRLQPIASAYAWRGDCKRLLDQLEETAIDVARAMRISSRDPDRSYWFNFLGFRSGVIDKPEDAIDTFRRAIEIVPQDTLHLTALLVNAAEEEEAHAMLKRLVELNPNFNVKQYQAFVPSRQPRYDMVGDRASR
jgi:hypothetical protein